MRYGYTTGSCAAAAAKAALFYILSGKPPRTVSLTTP
ncbi:MAG: cobalt-precorrin-5B (C(1))-methyltransferase, partial [Bacillota bacterium]|nr:cobalt-precorrin-5B (C(1))-methyltransferase [Bacillota bacterium]